MWITFGWACPAINTKRIATWKCWVHTHISGQYTYLLGCRLSALANHLGLEEYDLWMPTIIPMFRTAWSSQGSAKYVIMFLWAKRPTHHLWTCLHFPTFLWRILIFNFYYSNVWVWMHSSSIRTESFASRGRDVQEQRYHRGDVIEMMMAELLSTVWISIDSRTPYTTFDLMLPRLIWH